MKFQFTKPKSQIKLKFQFSKIWVLKFDILSIGIYLEFVF